jgi:urea transport system substrate-binding protein
MRIAALAWSLSRYWRVTLVAMTALLLSACQPEGGARQPIRIGVLHSLSGSMATSERPLVDAVRLAVEEINAKGGLLGRPVEIVLADGASDWPRFAAEAERLISQERVSALFACWTSACRKAVKPVVEKHQHLMFYPVQYEGLESSPNILYTGAAPNQQIIPGTRWALEHLGQRVYLLGSDYIFPRAANRIIRDLVEAGGGSVLGERYLPLGESDMRPALDDIRRLQHLLVHFARSHTR